MEATVENPIPDSSEEIKTITLASIQALCKEAEENEKARHLLDEEARSWLVEPEKLTTVQLCIEIEKLFLLERLPVDLMMILFDLLSISELKRIARTSKLFNIYKNDTITRRMEKTREFLKTVKEWDEWKEFVKNPWLRSEDLNVPRFLGYLVEKDKLDLLRELAYGGFGDENNARDAAYRAAVAGKIEFLVVILEGGFNPNYAYGENGPFFSSLLNSAIASQGGDITTIEILLKYGSDPNLIVALSVEWIGSKSYPPLAVAAQLGMDDNHVLDFRIGKSLDVATTLIEFKSTKYPEGAKPSLAIIYPELGTPLDMTAWSIKRLESFLKDPSVLRIIPPVTASVILQTQQFLEAKIEEFFELYKYLQKQQGSFRAIHDEDMDI